MSFSAPVKVFSIVGEARMLTPVSTSLVGRIGVTPRSAQCKCTSCPPTRAQPESMRSWRSSTACHD